MAQFVLGLVLPLAGLVMMILGTYVFFRGLGHAVNEGHAYGNMAKSVWVIVGSFLLLALMILVLFVALAIVGVGPEGRIVQLTEDLSL